MKTKLRRAQERNFNKYRIKGMLATCFSLKRSKEITSNESYELNQACYHLSGIIKQWERSTKCLKK